MRRIKIDKIDENRTVQIEVSCRYARQHGRCSLLIHFIHKTMRNLWKTEIRIPNENDEHVIKIRIHHNKLHVTKTEDDNENS